METFDRALSAHRADPATEADWRALVEKVLKGREFDTLVARTLDGIDIEPLYSSSPLRPPPPGVGPYIRGTRPVTDTASGWDVRTRHVLDDAAEVRGLMAADLANGATSVELVGRGAISADDLDTALTDVDLSRTAVVLTAGPSFDANAGVMLDLLARREVAPEAASGGLGADPLGVFAASDGTPWSMDDGVAAAGTLAARCAHEWPRVRALRANGRPYHDGGASDAQELAFLASTVVAYLRAAESAELPLPAAAAQLAVELVATADQFATIAKLRAARRIVARIFEAAGAATEARSVAFDAVTSTAMMTARDPWVNLLRATVAAMAAGVAGADSVTVMPFDAARASSGSLGVRMARNTQLILLEESHLATVADPAGGSWYVEELTEQLAQRAWSLFREVEAVGGMAAAISSGLVAERVEPSVAARDGAIAHRRQPIVGVSEFAHLAETSVDPPPSAADVVSEEVEVVAINPRPLRARRWAEPFEALRDASDDHLARTGHRPRVFLARLGSPADHTVRASWASNLFEAGGIEVVPDDGTGALEKLAVEFEASAAPLAVLCSSDERYESDAGVVAGALRHAGAARVYLAGKPGGHEAAWRGAGVDEFIFAGVDVLDVLRRAHEAAGTAS